MYNCFNKDHLSLPITENMIEESYRKGASCRAICGAPGLQWLCTYATDRMNEAKAFDAETLLQEFKVEKLKILFERHDDKFTFEPIMEAIEKEFPLAYRSGYNSQCALNPGNPTHAYFIRNGAANTRYEECINKLKKERKHSERNKWACAQSAGKELIPLIPKVQLNLTELLPSELITTWNPELPICKFRALFSKLILFFFYMCLH
jgi:hypothetical protein